MRPYSQCDILIFNYYLRVLASRMVDRETQHSLGLRHSRGLLLHGPPGTGKTLVARGLASLLSSRKPKLVEGPEVFSHLLGASEEAVRALFAKADDEVHGLPLLLSFVIRQIDPLQIAFSVSYVLLFPVVLQ